MCIQAIVFDMDDTLLRSDRTISDYTIKVLRSAKQKGIHIIPASGRAPASMRHYVDQIQCTSCYIAYNGSEIWSNQHELISRSLLDADLVRRIFAFADELGWYAHTYMGTNFYYTKQNDVPTFYSKASRLKGIYIPNAADDWAYPTVKVVLVNSADNVKYIMPYAKQRFGLEAQITCSKPEFLQFNPVTVSKGNAIKQVAELFGFSIDHTIAFGDSLNDLSMLTTVGHGIAMANARQEVHKLVLNSCQSNDQDGVAHYIQTHVLNNAEEL